MFDFWKHLFQVKGLDKVLRGNYDVYSEVAGEANTAVIWCQQMPPWPVWFRFTLPDALAFLETKQCCTIHCLQMICRRRKLSFHFVSFSEIRLIISKDFDEDSMAQQKQECPLHSGHNLQPEPNIRCQWACAMDSPFLLLNWLLLDLFCPRWSHLLWKTSLCSDNVVYSNTSVALMLY